MMSSEPDQSVWRKSSFSGGNGNRVEISWRTSSFSGTNGDCVEVGWQAADTVAVRDSKQTESPILAFPAADWHRFLAEH